MEGRQQSSFAVEGGRRTCLGIMHFKGMVFVASDLDPHLSQRIPPQNLPHAVLRYVSNESMRGVVFNSSILYTLAVVVSSLQSISVPSVLFLIQI
jgi:hypothetical protein